MTALDLLNFNTCNVDPLTETYDTSFYLTYISKWPEMCLAIEGRSGAIEGYSMTFLDQSMI
jgi:N-terminal acetyltransferase B complex catalytic subunit